VRPPLEVAAERQAQVLIYSYPKKGMPTRVRCGASAFDLPHL
jgi:hypothetical protein